MSLPNMVLGSALRLSRTSRTEQMAVSVSASVANNQIECTHLSYRLDCQSDLSDSITKLNPKSKLFVVREAPQSILPKLFRAWNVSHLVFEKDTDAYARERDEKVIQLARDAGVEVIVKTGRTLYDPDDLVKANGGKPTMSITQVEHVGKPLRTPRNSTKCRPGC